MHVSYDCQLLCDRKVTQKHCFVSEDLNVYSKQKKILFWSNRILYNLQSWKRRMCDEISTELVLWHELCWQNHSLYMQLTCNTQKCALLLNKCTLLLNKCTLLLNKCTLLLNKCTLLLNKCTLLLNKCTLLLTNAG